MSDVNASNFVVFSTQSNRLNSRCKKVLMQHSRSFQNATLQINILHLNLSASHVLLSDEMTCKLTGFSSADDVKERHRRHIESDVSLNL